MSGASTPLPLVPVPPGKSSYLKRFRRMAASVPEVADLILLGDSLAASWPATLYPEAFPGRRVLNLGLTGDRVQNTLWRLGVMNIQHLRPREIVLLLGTNNLGDGDEVEAIACGIERLLSNVRLIWDEPQTYIVTIPRRGPDPGLCEAERVRLNNILRSELPGSLGAVLIEADAVLDCLPPAYSSLLPDLLHLSPDGYRRLSAALLSASAAIAAR